MASTTVRVKWRSSPVSVVTYGGRRYTQDFADALRELDRLCTNAGIDITVTQGGFNGSNVSASAGTHAGDAADLSVRGMDKSEVTKVITLARTIGLAAWFRTTRFAKFGTRAQGFSSYHIHIVPNGWGVASPEAVKQGNRYRQGRDGLASNQADIGPGHISTYRTRTWAEYKRLAGTTTPTSPSKPTTHSKPTTPTSPGGLTMADIDVILNRLSGIEAQNRAIHDSVAGGTNVRKRREEDTVATWAFPVHRSSGDTAIISEITNQTALLQAINSQILGLAKNSGTVDEKAIVAGVVAGITPVLRNAIVQAQGDIDLVAAETFADAVLDAFKEQLNK